MTWTLVIFAIGTSDFWPPQYLEHLAGEVECHSAAAALEQDYHQFIKGALRYRCVVGDLREWKAVR